MHVSHEHPVQSTARLVKVLAAAEWVVHDRVYAFEEFGAVDFPA
jgi:hypothetical protein